MSNIFAIAAARSVDLKLQAWAADQTAQQLWTRWKESPAEPAAWTKWQLFPNPLTVSGSTIEVQYLFAAQLALQGTGAFPIGTDRSVAGKGRMQLWAILLETPAASNPSSHIYTTVKSAEQVNAPWELWQKFDANLLSVNPATASFLQGAVVSLPDGRLQLWVVIFDEANPTTSLWTRVQTSTSFDASYNGTQTWTPWQKCTQPLPVGWTISGDPTACQLPDGSTQLWVIGYNENNNPNNFAVLSSHLAPGADPLTGWTAWSVFKPVPLEANNPIQALRAITDGNGRAYLWYSYAGIPTNNTVPISWYYVHTGTQPPVAWSAPFTFPLPSVANAQTVNHDEYYNRVVTLAVLPNKGLQLFLLDTKQLNASAPIDTSWQMPPPPNNWFATGSLAGGWSDFSVP